jgi:hypothetical protein
VKKEFVKQGPSLICVEQQPTVRSYSEHKIELNTTTSVFTSINSSRYLNLSEGEGDSRPQRFLVRAWHAVQIRRVHRPLHVERVPCKHIGRDTAKKIR